jgi:hypothetical protein
LTSTFKHDNWCRIIFTLELTNQSYSISSIQLEYIFKYAKSHHVWYTNINATSVDWLVELSAPDIGERYQEEEDV